MMDDRERESVCLCMCLAMTFKNSFPMLIPVNKVHLHRFISVKEKE